MTGLQPWLRGSPAGRIGLRALAVTVVMIVLSAVFAAGAASAAAGSRYRGPADRPDAGMHRDVLDPGRGGTGPLAVGARPSLEPHERLGHGHQLQDLRGRPGTGAAGLRHRRDRESGVDRGGAPRPGQARDLLHRGRGGGQLPGRIRHRTMRQFKAAGVLGAPMSGYSENYLNINSPATVAIVEQIIHDQCDAKGFDAVEPDIDDSWYDTTGFTISMANEEAYLATLSGYAHSLGLSLGAQGRRPSRCPRRFGHLHRRSHRRPHRRLGPDRTELPVRDGPRHLPRLRRRRPGAVRGRVRGRPDQARRLLPDRQPRQHQHDLVRHAPRRQGPRDLPLSTRRRRPAPLTPRRRPFRSAAANAVRAASTAFMAAGNPP